MTKTNENCDIRQIDRVWAFKVHIDENKPHVVVIKIQSWCYYIVTIVTVRYDKATAPLSHSWNNS